MIGDSPGQLRRSSWRALPLLLAETTPFSPVLSASLCSRDSRRDASPAQVGRHRSSRRRWRTHSVLRAWSRLVARLDQRSGRYLLRNRAKAENTSPGHRPEFVCIPIERTFMRLEQAIDRWHIGKCGRTDSEIPWFDRAHVLLASFLF